MLKQHNKMTFPMDCGILFLSLCVSYWMLYSKTTSILPTIHFQRFVNPGYSLLRVFGTRLEIDLPFFLAICFSRLQKVQKLTQGPISKVVESEETIRMAQPGQVDPQYAAAYSQYGSYASYGPPPGAVSYTQAGQTAQAPAAYSQAGYTAQSQAYQQPAAYGQTTQAGYQQGAYPGYQTSAYQQPAAAPATGAATTYQSYQAPGYQSYQQPAQGYQSYQQPPATGYDQSQSYQGYQQPQQQTGYQQSGYSQPQSTGYQQTSSQQQTSGGPPSSGGYDSQSSYNDRGSRGGGFGNRGGSRGGYGGGSRGSDSQNGGGPQMTTRVDTVFVSGLPSAVRENELAEYFGKIGIIKMDRKTNGPKIHLYKHPDGTGKGEATITYDDPPSASAAINWFHDKEFLQGSGVKMNVSLATFNAEAFGPRGRGRGRGRGGDRGGYGDRMGPKDMRGGFRGGRGGGGGGPGGDQRSGDWTCSSCGNMNFARRMECNRCHEPKDEDAGGDGGPPGRGRGGGRGGFDRGGRGGRGGMDRGRDGFRGGRGGGRGGFDRGRGGFRGGRGGDRGGR